MIGLIHKHKIFVAVVLLFAVQMVNVLPGSQRTSEPARDYKSVLHDVHLLGLAFSGSHHTERTVRRNIDVDVSIIVDVPSAFPIPIFVARFSDSSALSTKASDALLHSIMTDAL